MYFVELQNHINITKKYFLSFLNQILLTINLFINAIKYLVEQCYENAETKDNNRRTSLYCALANDQIEVIKYLIEKCHANV
jgi:hypothetical protein